MRGHDYDSEFFHRCRRLVPCSGGPCRRQIFGKTHQICITSIPNKLMTLQFRPHGPVDWVVLGKAFDCHWARVLLSHGWGGGGCWTPLHPEI